MKDKLYRVPINSDEAPYEVNEDVLWNDIYQEDNLIILDQSITIH